MPVKQFYRAAVVGLAVFAAGCGDWTPVSGTCRPQLVDTREGNKVAVRKDDNELSAGLLSTGGWVTYDGSLRVSSRNARVIVESIHEGPASGADSMLIAVDGVECNSRNGEEAERIRASCTLRRGTHDLHVRIRNSSRNHHHINFCGKGYKFRIEKFQEMEYMPGEEDLYPPAP